MKPLNLCASFLFPLIEIQPISFFGSQNILECYISQEYQLVAQVKSLHKARHAYAHPQFADVHDTPTSALIYFSLPERFYREFDLFIQGSYSLFGQEARQLICQYSGLQYRQVCPENPSVAYSDVELLALFADPDYRSFIEKELNVRLPEGCELLGKPDLAYEMY